MGGDGGSGSINRDVARDAYGYSLNYFTGEYFPISGQSPFAGHSGKLPAGQYRPLYNGNISSMMVNLGGATKPLVYNYQYDQLNRLVAMDSYKELNATKGLNQAINQWDTLVNTGEYKERIAYDANGNILKYLRQGYGSNLTMDSLTYNYNSGTNQLNYIRDQVGGSTAHKNNYTTDLEDQAQNNYGYDEIGNLVKDGINLYNVKWSVYGKILHMDVRPVVIGDATSIDQFYDPQGNRIGKSINHYQTPPSYLWYVRDAQGNVMAVYQIQNNPDFSAGPLKLIEQDIYGSSRLGVIQRNMDADQVRVQAVNANLIGDTYTYSLQRGVRNYELSNHLGNVLTTITDQRKGVDTTGDGVMDYYMPVVVSSQDYYPFGMEMPGRSFSSPSYRYGFNGKEKDSEVKGEGNQYDYGMRIYDPRVGKFLSVDPLQQKYPNLTPYQYSSNSPIAYIDIDGLEKYHYALTLDDQGNSQVQLTSVEDFSEWQWRPKWGGTVLGFQLWEKVENPRKEYIVDYKYTDIIVVGGAAGQVDATAKHTFSSENDALNATLNDFEPEFRNNDIAKGVLAGLGTPGIPRTVRGRGTTVPEVATNKSANRLHGGNSEAAEANAAKPQSKFLGGAKGNLYSKKMILEANHTPTMQSYEIAGFKISYNKGSAFQMLYEEHRKFISTGNSKNAQVFRAQEGALLKQGKFMEAFELTANQIQKAFGNKYNDAIQQARTYYQTNIVPQLQKQLAAKTATSN